MAVRICKVFCRDLQGVEHSVEVSAQSVFEAVAQGFALLPRRWVVERTLAWLNRNLPLAKDFEATIANAETWLCSASVKPMVRRLPRA